MQETVVQESSTRRAGRWYSLLRLVLRTRVSQVSPAKCMFHGSSGRFPSWLGGLSVQWLNPCGNVVSARNIEEREEGGTPDILGAIRLGLVFQMKQRLGSVEVRRNARTRICWGASVILRVKVRVRVRIVSQTDAASHNHGSLRLRLSILCAGKSGQNTETLTLTLSLSFGAPLCYVPGKAREDELAQLGLATLRANPRICLLGDTGRRRLPIFSFMIRHADR